jgi:TRAP-type C4-dicarboxylate transport system substrate-binding protein
MTSKLRIVIAVVVASQAPRTHAEPEKVLKLATTAPDGTMWARELRAMGQRVEQATHGQLGFKWYFNAVAGDEVEVGDRIRRQQLDGAALTIYCERISPSMRVGRLLARDWDEARQVLSQLEPILEAEAHQAGIVFTGSGPIGNDVLFTRVPVHNMAELRRLKIWKWDQDEMGIAIAREMGMQVVPMSITAAARAYDEGKLDGFSVIPTAALAFQLAVRARYLVDIRSGFVSGCPIFAERTFLALSTQQQQAIRESAAVVRERVDAASRQAESQLMGGLLQKQGVIPVAVSETFRAEFFEGMRAAREKVADKFVPRELQDRVLKILADYRVEHPSAAKR